MNGGEAQAVCRDGGKLFHVRRNPASRSAERESGTYNDRIADEVGEFKSRLCVCDHAGGNDRLTDGFHCFLEEFAVFRFFNGLQACSEQLDALLFQEAFAGELHGERQTGLSAKRGEQAIRLFAADDFSQRRQSERFNVNLVGDRSVRHNGGRIGVDEDDVQSFLPKGAARLRSGVVEFRGLADHNRTGADDENLFEMLL